MAKQRKKKECPPMPKQGTPEWSKLRQETMDCLIRETIIGWRIHEGGVVLPISVLCEAPHYLLTGRDKPPIAVLPVAQPNLYAYTVRLYEEQRYLGWAEISEGEEPSSWWKGYLEAAMPLIWEDNWKQENPNEKA
jgi:hypothetical protein